ncbi:MAG: phosphoenolpyruvate-protein phosphotransferase [Pirellulaceae bacterium]|nr:MAG: phosphoenolpyruvate-protein phosphotransferase [Pirellulaceae bacterium]
MLELSGIAVSPGVAIGKALILDREGYRITRTEISPEDSEAECERLDQAIRQAISLLDQRCAQTTRTAGSQVGAIFAAHQQFLLDPVVRSEWDRLIRVEHVSAEYAVSTVLNRFAQAFRQFGSDMLAERVEDIRDVERTLLEALGGQPVALPGQLEEPSILLSHDLTPSETAQLDPQTVLGFCTESGGPGGHTAIVARGMDLPAIVAVGPFLHRIGKDSLVVLDGYHGKVLIDPRPDILRRYEEEILLRRDRSLQLGKMRSLPAKTRDGRRIALFANIEFPAEATLGLERGAEGIGLYRTEFLFLGRSQPPEEQEQYEVYRDVVERAQGKPVVMRTLDLGADKVNAGLPMLAESNPVLGLRSIRFSLRYPDLLRSQLRAMLRAAAHGPVRIMFPMVTTLEEWRRARAIVDEVMGELERAGWRAAVPIELGMMLEVPAAILLLDKFAPVADFFSIGTNDLIQYTMAVDRSNEWVADLYAPFDPAVLRLIRRAVEVAEAHRVPISVCGEMSSSPATAALLIGLGIENLSAPPSALPDVKQAIRHLRHADCRQVAERALEQSTASEVRRSVQEFLQESAPELLQHEVLPR